MPSIVAFDEHQCLLRCWGDEDRSTQGRRRRAFSRALRAGREVVVDLSGLAFADISLLLDVAVLANRLRSGGARVVLRGAPPQISALIARAGLHRLPGVGLEPPGAAARA